MTVEFNAEFATDQNKFDNCKEYGHLNPIRPGLFEICQTGGGGRGQNPPIPCLKVDHDQIW